VTERETTRLVAWSQELRRVHARLREALRVTRAALADGRPGQVVTLDLLVFCHGFCAALDGHHRGEDRMLFPHLAASNPELRPVLDSLEQDHAMIAQLLAGLSEAVERSASVDELGRRLDGVAAIMENHFRYEERRLLTVLETLELQSDAQEILGPF
jgi:hemerythrin-like domain-containing protein